MDHADFKNRILKLRPGRDDRRLVLIHRGHVELRNLIFMYSVNYGQLCRWGLLEQHYPVHFLDAYDGHRPTKAGMEYFLYEEEFHLILCRKSRVHVLQDRATREREVGFAAAMADFAAEVQAARASGWRPDLHKPKDPKRAVVLRRYEAKGYLHLDGFLQRHGLNHDELVVAGVLRYKNTTTGPLLIVGPKGKPCLLLSSRWQLLLVRPGQEQALLDASGIVG